MVKPSGDVFDIHFSYSEATPWHLKIFSAAFFLEAFSGVKFTKSQLWNIALIAAITELKLN